MVLDWFSRSKASSVDELIARKSYAQAVELIKGQLEEHGKNERLTKQLAHSLTLAGRKGEATAVLDRLADDLAADGFATKAIAVLKKLQKLEPGRSGIDERLAALIELKAPPAVAAWVDSSPRPEAGFEIGMELEEAPPVGVTEGRDLPPPERGGAATAAPSALATDAPPVLETPLFRSLSREETLAVIRGLRLHTWGPGRILVTEGEPGDSLYVLTTGRCRAYVRDARGRSVEVRELHEGDFFGEIALLTLQPRTATITTVTPCELLELDRETLESITRSFPRVKEVLTEFHALRAGTSVEAAIRGMGAV